jgi:hypothetical protein
LPVRSAALRLTQYINTTMQPLADKRTYLTAEELASAADVSTATIWRLKRDGKIPFFQPGGAGHLVKFPPDALEQRSDKQHGAGGDAESLNPKLAHNTKDALEPEGNQLSGNLHSTDCTGKQSRLSGPTPKWMRK